MRGKRMNRKHEWFVKVQALCMAAMITLAALCQPVKVQAAEVVQPSLGIDVSRYQGQIDWAQVAASGVQFAMIRVGYRTQNTGVLNEDPYVRYNLQEATKAGIKVGAYFFSSAVNAQEAVEEAEFTANILDKYQITYPVAYDCEGFRNSTSRQYALGKDVRTALAVGFLDVIAQRGYTPMFYASKNEMEGSRDWNMDVLASKYKVWVSWYPELPFPQTPACTYTGIHSMWQYTAKAAIAGVGGLVDMNIAYFAYTEVAAAKDASGAVQVDASAAANVQYTEVYEVVTPSSENLNLRTVPSTAGNDTIVVTIHSGDMIFRTGVGNNGWSKVLLNGVELYASSSYLKKVM